MSRRISKAQTSARRQLLKTLMAGGGAVTVGRLVPRQWKRPVVASVMLPAHAQATANCDEFDFSGPDFRILTQDPPGTLVGSAPISGTISGGTFSASGSFAGATCLDGGGSASIYLSVTGTVDGPYFVTQSVICNGTPAAYCEGSGSAYYTYISTYTNVALTGSYSCQVCTNLIQVSTTD